MKNTPFTSFSPLPFIASLHALVHAYSPSKCEDTLGTGECRAPVPSLSDLCFWKGPSLLNFRKFLNIDSLLCWNSFTQVKKYLSIQSKRYLNIWTKAWCSATLAVWTPSYRCLVWAGIYPFQSHSLFCCLKSPLSLSLLHNWFIAPCQKTNKKLGTSAHSSMSPSDHFGSTP